MRKIMRVLLSVLLAVFCFTNSADTVHASALTYEICIGKEENLVMVNQYYHYDTNSNAIGNAVDPDSDWNVHYADGILTFRNLTVNQTGLFEEVPVGTSGTTTTIISMGIFITSNSPMKINLEGKNNVTLENPKDTEGNYPEFLYGIYMVNEESDTISGSGELHVKTTLTQRASGSNKTPCAIAIDNVRGELTIESGTITAEATGMNDGIGLGSYGLNHLQDNAIPDVIISSRNNVYNSEGVTNNSLFITGGSITASGTAPGIEKMAKSGSATGIASLGAAYISGGNIHATASGKYLSVAFASAAGEQFSGGDTVLVTTPYPDSDSNNIAIRIYYGFPAQFNPVISVINGETILEAETTSGNAMADTGINTYQFEGEDFATIGPKDGSMTDLAAYAHIGLASVPASTPATSTSSGWVPSYEIQFKNCSGKVISDQWVAEGQPATIPSGYTYGEEELNWVYRNLTVSPTSCKATGYVVPNTADKG